MPDALISLNPQPESNGMDSGIILYFCNHQSIFVSIFIFIFMYRHSESYEPMQKEYISPEVEILDVVSEGVLCASNELLEETEGEW